MFYNNFPKSVCLQKHITHTAIRLLKTLPLISSPIRVHCYVYIYINIFFENIYTQTVTTRTTIINYFWYKLILNLFLNKFYYNL